MVGAENLPSAPLLKRYLEIQLTLMPTLHQVSTACHNFSELGSLMLIKYESPRSASFLRRGSGSINMLELGCGVCGVELRVRVEAGSDVRLGFQRVPQPVSSWGLGVQGGRI